jgi:hypothetical protein
MWGSVMILGVGSGSTRTISTGGLRLTTVGPGSAGMGRAHVRYVRSVPVSGLAGAERSTTSPGILAALACDTGLLAQCGLACCGLWSGCWGGVGVWSLGRV